jgi:DNA-binding response OmpR family regulator
MTKKRILLIHGDRLLQQFYREKLEEGGYMVDVRHDLEDAEAILSDRKPDVILLDLVQQHGRAVSFIKLLRADPSAEKIPVLILPTILNELANAAFQAGATKVIHADGSPITSIINAVRGALGQPELLKGETIAFFQPEDSWVDLIYSDALKAINAMRQCLPGLTATPPDPAALRGLWLHVHGFAGCAAFLPGKPLGQFLEALDLLLHDLNEAPDQLNPSTLRTIGQALDFLAKIANPYALERLADPSAARILIVDDEPGALQFISAALHLAELKAETADTPSAALEKLGDAHWDLIFLDIGLPQVDGFQLCTKIRTIEKLKTTPIVFITGMASFKNKATACLSGGNDFVGKPFNLCELGVKALTWLYRGQLKMV